MTCKKCNRALNDGDADKNGMCIFCAPKVEPKPEKVAENSK